MAITEEIESLSRRDPLSYGITYVDLLDGKYWEVATRAWMPDIYGAVSPWEIEKYPEGLARKMSVLKPTQIGMSTMGIVRLLHFATNWPVRIMYTLPRQTDVLDFTTTRLDPTIEASPYLKSKLGQPNSVHAKRLGDSYIYVAEMSVEARMLPIDAIFVDEVDLSDANNVSTALNRLDASRWKLNYFFSTPTLPGYGIHGIYLDSDMREWLVKCEKCGYEQRLDWEQNLRIVGAHNNPEKVFYGCAKCNAEITPQHIQTGRWVAQRPDQSPRHIGFHVSQMMTQPADVLYARFRDPQTKIVEFYRKTLGIPYEIGGGSLSRDDFLTTCFDEPYDFEPSWDGESAYYLGADQGNEIQVIISKIVPDSRRPKVVHIELVPIEKGFDRLAQLINLYHVRRAVVDANPNRHDVVKMTASFPGRVLAADYIEQKAPWTLRKAAQKDYTTNVYINRTAMFDDLMDSIKKGEWALPGSPPILHPDVELVIDHVTALKRDIETRRTSSGETQVAVYRKLRAEHLAHAWLYMRVAIESDRGRGKKVAVIGTQHSNVASDKPADDNVVGITAILAEVPASQLVELVHKIQGKANIAEYATTAPFPLSYKLQKVLDLYSLPEIEWVATALLSDKINDK